MPRKHIRSMQQRTCVIYVFLLVCLNMYPMKLQSLCIPNLVLCNKSLKKKLVKKQWACLNITAKGLLSIICGTYPDKQNQQQSSEQVTWLIRFRGQKLGTIKPNEGKGEKSAMSITRRGEADSFLTCVVQLCM